MSRWVGAPVLASLLIVSGCETNTPASSGNAAANSVLRLAVTTSTRDSGLLDMIVPVFEQWHNARVDVIAAGTGKALKLGESGDVDVVLVHAREAEDAFMAAGHGSRREDVMYNMFEIVGPPGDEAEIGDLNAAEALRKIAEQGAVFVSRGDDSGTHKRELALWKKAGKRPEWDGYLESGQGMGATLVMADQKQGYALCDRGTYLAMRDKLELEPLVAASDELKNPYGVITVNAKKHESVNAALADEFVDFLISFDIQRAIRDFKVNGEALFHPLRISENL